MSSETKPKTDIPATMGTEAVRQVGGISKEAITQTGTVLKELLHASMSHPLLGVVSALIFSDILQKLGVIYPHTAHRIREIAYFAAGLSLVRGVEDVLVEIPADLLTALTGRETAGTELLATKTSIDATSQSTAAETGKPVEVAQRLLPILSELGKVAAEAAA